MEQVRPTEPNRADPSTARPETPAAAKLKPKEHGAYAILGIPICTALIMTGPTVVGSAVAVASIAGFLAHEPLLVAIGHRGKRAQRTTPNARKRMVVLLALAFACGLIAIAAGSIAARYSLAGCALLAVVSFSMAIADKHRTLGGQIWGVIGLSAPCLPILLGGEISPAVAVELWGTWLLGFASTTMAVRGVIAAQKRQSRVIHWSALVAISITVAALAAAGFRKPIVTLPMLAMAWYLVAAPPPAQQLKRVGWTLVAGTVVSAIWMVLEQ